MNDNETNTGGWEKIIGGIVLIALLFVGVKFVFWGLEQVIRQDVPDVPPGASADVSGEPDAPSFCLYCGKTLPDSFRWGQFCPYCGEKNEL